MHELKGFPFGPSPSRFHADFGVGVPGRIHVVDANGVMLAALQGLHQRILEQDHEIKELEREISRARRKLR
jgi:hypothetical protein